MIRACSICSGSSANSIYIEIDGEAILIDAGCSLRTISCFLKEIDSSLERIKAVFITHEHRDHIKGVEMLAKRGIPIIANRRTLNSIDSQKPDINSAVFREMPLGFTAKNGSFSVTSFKTSHDSAESVGYVINTEKGNIGIVTDLGVYDEKTVEAIKNCRLLFIEANHDENMLWQGCYPYPLKKRIAGFQGHLSNSQCASLLCEVGDGVLETAVLSHLSQENNTPEKAKYEVSRAISEKIRVLVAPRFEKSEFILL